MKNLNTYNLYQITSANKITIRSKRLYKNNYENTVYKNYNTTIVRLVDARKFKYYISHEKINRCLTDINRCLTDIFKI